MISAYLTNVACLECGYQMAADAYASTACSACGGHWLDAQYDYDQIAKLWPTVLQRRERSLWRYAELLPIQRTHPEISMGEGATPLSRLYAYEQIYGHEGIFIKDERAQPTNSFKDRQAALSVMAMKQQGIQECVLASTGNAAVAYAAYCARAGIKLWLFLTSLVPSEKMREAALYGCEVVKVSGTYDETKSVAAEFAQRKGIHFDRGAKSVPGKESMKTLAFEIAEQLGLVLSPDEDKWQAPDWYIQAVSGGIGPLGVMKGFEELKRIGLIDKVPKLGIVQAAGCAPMAEAFARGDEQARAVIPQTLITVLATGDPGHSYVALRKAILTHGGAMLAVEDGETFRAMRKVASKGGLSVEPATAVAFAGLEKMLADGSIAADERVVVNCSGHTFPAESHILGDQYERYILDLQVQPQAAHAVKVQQEGLGAALKNLDEQVTTIVIIDDNPNDRRLIRRLLQSYKQYRVYEARDGAEGMSVIRDRQPDLVVCDLTMPGMDGFALLEAVKADPATSHIPVIVVSAKSLTSHDRETLDQLSTSVWTKGGFDTRLLVDHVVSTLGHDPIEVIQQASGHNPARSPETRQPNSEASHTIVVIDDNASDLRLVRRIIESGGNYNIIEANNGRDGMKAIYNYHPDLIVLDLMIPDLDGFSILEKLQKDVNLCDIPVIVNSAREVSESERQAWQQQIRQIIHKSSMDRRSFLNLIQNELSN